VAKLNERSEDGNRILIWDVPCTIPELLPSDTIKAIRNRVAASKTYLHGHVKHKYLFSRMVFCGHCYRAMNGQEKKGFRYYRHANGCPNCLGGIVRADDLEDRVIPHLFETFGNPAALKRAIEEATPNREKVEETRQRLKVIDGELQKISKGRDRILRLISSDAITDAQAKGQLTKLKERESRMQNEQERLENSINHIPSPASYNGQRLGSAKLWALKSRAGEFDRMTWEEKRKLVQTVFDGTALDGRRMGVYVERIDGQTDRRRRRWKYVIHGLVQYVDGTEESLGAIVSKKSSHWR
jgi:hypothetical protein